MAIATESLTTPLTQINNMEEEVLFEKEQTTAQDSAKENLDMVRVLVYRYFSQAVLAACFGLSQARQVIHEATKFDEEDTSDDLPSLQECDASDSSYDDDDDDDSVDVIPVVSKRTVLVQRTVDATKASIHQARRVIYNATKSAAEKEQERLIRGALSEEEEVFIRHKMLLNTAIRASKNSLTKVKKVVHEITKKEESSDIQKRMKDIQEQMKKEDGEPVNKSLLVKAVNVTKSRLDQARQVIHDATKPAAEDDETEASESKTTAENLFHSPHPASPKATFVITNSPPSNASPLPPNLMQMAALYNEIEDAQEEAEGEKKDDATTVVEPTEQQPKSPTLGDEIGKTRLHMMLSAMD